MKRLFFTFLLFVTGCASQQLTADEQYKQGMMAVQPRTGMGKIFLDCRTAATGLQQFVDQNPFDARAPLAQRHIAGCYESEKNWSEAEGAWRTFLALYPGHTEVTRALLGLAESQFQQRDTTDRDQNKLKQALGSFSRLIRDYPASSEAGKAADRYNEIRTQLAEHDWRIGEWYRRQGLPLAAYTRWQSVAEQFPDTEWGRKAADGLAELKPGNRN